MDEIRVIDLPAGRRDLPLRWSGRSRALWAVPFLLLMLMMPSESRGQAEVWLDYFANFPAGRYWTYEGNAGIAKGVTHPVWLDTYLTGNATYQDQNWLSTEGNLEAHYTFNTAAEDLFELRPWVGLNFIWPTYGEHWNLFYPSFSVRFEDRFLWYQSTGTQETKQRMRLRVSARFPLNNQTLTVGTYYLLFLLEGYVPLNGEVREMSADRKRFQAGVGYVVASNLRVELQYILMRTRNTELNTFETTSHIAWLAVRNFF